MSGEEDRGIRSKVEFLYKEVLGECVTLVERIEDAQKLIMGFDAGFSKKGDRIIDAFNQILRNSAKEYRESLEKMALSVAELSSECSTLKQMLENERTHNKRREVLFGVAGFLIGGLLVAFGALFFF